MAPPSPALIAAHGRLMGAAPARQDPGDPRLRPARQRRQATTISILKGLEWAAAQRRARHQHELCRSDRSGAARAARRRAQEGHRADRRRRQCRREVAAAISGRRSERDRGQRDRRDDNLFERSNRGKHIASRRPASTVLLPSPATAMRWPRAPRSAAADVSGIAALLLQRDAALTPDKLRKILEPTAKDLGPKGRDIQFGFGLADAYAAVAAQSAPVARASAPR